MAEEANISNGKMDMNTHTLSCDKCPWRSREVS